LYAQILEGPILEWINFGYPKFDPIQFGSGPKLTMIDENFSIQLWIKSHNCLQFFTSPWCELVVQKRGDC